MSDQEKVEILKSVLKDTFTVLENVRTAPSTNGVISLSLAIVQGSIWDTLEIIKE